MVHEGSIQNRSRRVRRGSARVDACVRAGRRRQYDGVDQRQGCRLERRRAARRHGFGDEPVDDGHPDLGQRRWRQLPVSGASAGHLRTSLRATRLHHAQARKYSDLDGVHRDGERRPRGRVAAGDGHGDGQFAGHRHLVDASSRTSSSRRCRRSRTHAISGRCSR